MTQHITRRAVTKGAAWAVPAVAVTASAPFAAASDVPCSDESKKAIDKAFADALVAAKAVTSPQFEINLDQYMAANDGFAQTVFVNVKNISGVDQFVDYAGRLAFTVNTYAAATAPSYNDVRDGRSINQITSSWGQFKINNSEPWYKANQIAYTQQPNVRNSSWVQAKDALEQSVQWEFYGGTLKKAQTMDFAIAFGDGLESLPKTNYVGYRHVQYMTVTATVNPARALLPDLTVEEACQAYFDEQAATFDAATAGTPASQFIVRGPLTGSTVLNVGQTIDSRVVGNYVDGATYTTFGNANGIF